jgi:hypothetical protein
VTGVQVEYVGFTTNERAREYTLRVRQKAAEAIEVTLSIDSQAFLDKRVRYQDGPEICFLKLQKELTAADDGRVPSRLSVVDADLEEYKTAHAPKAPRRHPPQPTPPIT